MANLRMSTRTVEVVGRYKIDEAPMMGSKGSIKHGSHIAPAGGKSTKIRQRVLLGLTRSYLPGCDRRCSIFSGW